MYFLLKKMKMFFFHLTLTSRSKVNLKVTNENVFYSDKLPICNIKVEKNLIFYLTLKMRSKVNFKVTSKKLIFVFLFVFCCDLRPICNTKAVK